MFVLSFVRRPETEGGNDRLAIEEIGAAGIRDQGTRNSSALCFRFCAEQCVEGPGVKTDFSARKTFEVFGRQLRIELLALEEGPEVSVTGLRSNFAGGHPQVRTHDGAEPENGIDYLCHGEDYSEISSFVKFWCFRWELNPQQRF